MADPLFRSLVQQMQSWFSQAKAVDQARKLLELPQSVETQVLQHLQHSPSPRLYQTTIQDAITEAVQRWQENLDAPNHLIILGNPVEPIAKILEDSWQSWQNPILPPQRLLPTLSRPHTPQQIYSELQQATQPYQTQSDDAAADADTLENRQTLLVIPCLEQCFLRCIGGWDGIEYFRDVALANQNCFWVMGCNHWAWDFLDFVCQISAYFDLVHPLPDLEGEHLQDWLEAIAPPTILTALSLDSEEDSSSTYWKTLSNQASGISTIAAHLWTQSLRTAADEEQPPFSLDADPPLPLQQISPFLPSLPSLTPKDRYILHAVLIHGRITRHHLALSLGESETIIQSYVQVLLRKGLLQQQKGQLLVCASHYAKLKTELANNNFFVGED
ncbi:MAG: MarR family transcriptional regulator [Kamptonema sp. SIO4C4]|nr:MarR family transcriptional regulator [Kamptonema sp. SIO4C4]